MEPCVYQDKNILFIRASGGENRPYQAPKNLGDKAEKGAELGYYIRRHSSTVEVKRNSPDWTELMELAAKIPFDDRVNQNASLADLELPLIIEHLKKAKSALFPLARDLDFEALAHKMRLVKGPPEWLRPVNAALMFFNSQPEEFFPGSQINILQFPDGVAGKRILRKEFAGPIGQQLLDALSYLRDKVLIEATIKERGRAESSRAWNYPYEAIEELLPNAVYHRSYEIREPIEVRVEPERLTITSYPGPDRSIRLIDLKRGKLIARRYRNRRVGDLLRQIDLAEEAGTGIPTAILEMRRNGSPPPKFDTDEERSYFTAILPVHPAFLRGNLGGDLGVVSPPVAPLQPREQLILEFCLTPRSRAEIQKLFGLKDGKNFREKYLAPLIAQNFLRFTDPANPTASSQKYQTTKAGQERFKQRREPTLFD